MKLTSNPIGSVVAIRLKAFQPYECSGRMSLHRQLSIAVRFVLISTTGLIIYVEQREFKSRHLVVVSPESSIRYWKFAKPPRQV